MPTWNFLEQEIEEHYGIEGDNVKIVIPHPPWALKVVNDCPDCVDGGDQLHLTVDWSSKSLRGKITLHFIGNCELATFELDDQFLM